MPATLGGTVWATRCAARRATTSWRSSSTSGRRPRPCARGPATATPWTSSTACPPQAIRLVRAFSSYFYLANLAEQAHRFDGPADGTGEPSGAGADLWLGDDGPAGVGTGRLAAVVAELDVRPVFTAHPTEATRRGLLRSPMGERVRSSCFVGGSDRGGELVERGGDA